MVAASTSLAILPTTSSPPSRSSSRAASPAIPVVQPDHFYGAEGIPLPPSPRSEGKTWLDPDEDPLASRGIPVFKPTMEEFKDFEGFMKRIECWGQRSGIVKVIPPKPWKDALPSTTDKLSRVKLHHPIEQHMIGRAGLFRQKNVETTRIFSVREWAELCGKDVYRAPGVDDLGPHHAPPPSSLSRSSRSRQRTKENTTSTEQSSATPNPLVSPATTPVIASCRLDSETQFHSLVQEDDAAFSSSASVRESEKVKGKRKVAPRVSRSARAAERAAKDEAFMQEFDPDSDWLPPNTTPFDYTPDFCRQLERRFWRMCGMGTPAQYGADMAGSLFHDESTPWNVANLPSTLERIMPRVKCPTPGVNLPYLYFGMWRATFAWHVEDCDLFSINYIHFGAGKFWYAIPQARANAFETVMRGYFPEGPNSCSQFLRHKAFLASPTILAQQSCRPNTLVQHSGEFVITYPRGYHAGFNLGFNCAESTNFALESWLELGRKAKYCSCVGDSVRIDVDALLLERELEYTEKAAYSVNELREQKAPPEMERYEDEEDEGEESRPQPFSSSVSEIAPSFQPPSAISHPPPVPSPRKRKAGNLDIARPQLLKRSKPSTAHPSITSSTTKVILKLGPPPLVDVGFPCVLCVSTSRDGLLPVHGRPGAAHAAFASIAEGPWMAHEQCARLVPETWVDESYGANPEGTRTRAVFGVENIVRDRLNLRCAVCTTMRAKMHGAPVQCTKGKCLKAFHISCARESTEIMFEEFETEREVVATTLGGTFAPMDVVKVVNKSDFRVLCAQHNPDILKVRKANKEDKIRQELLAIPPGARIKIRGHSGVFEVSLVRVDTQERAVEVLWDRGVQRTFKWNNVILNDLDAPASAVSPRCIPSQGTSAAKAQPLRGVTEALAVAQASSSDVIPPSLSSLSPNHSFTNLD